MFLKNFYCFTVVSIIFQIITVICINKMLSEKKNEIDSLTMVFFKCAWMKADIYFIVLDILYIIDIETWLLEFEYWVGNSTYDIYTRRNSGKKLGAHYQWRSATKKEQGSQLPPPPCCQGKLSKLKY